MKLVDILARELKSWPDDAFALVQAGRLYDAGWRKQVTP